MACALIWMCRSPARAWAWASASPKGSDMSTRWFTMLRDSMSLRAMASKSSITEPSCLEVATMRCSASRYCAAERSLPRKVISASPRMAVVGVRSSWLMSANNVRRRVSVCCSDWLASCKALVRSRTSVSNRWRCSVSSCWCFSSAAAMAFMLRATSENSSWSFSATRCCSEPWPSMCAPCTSSSMGRRSARAK